MFAHLSPELISEIRRFFNETQIPYDSELRSILLNGVHFQFVQSLKKYGNDSFQLTGDLNTMNTVERLSDGRIPLETWLRNAVDQLSFRTEAKVFNRALDELTTRKSVAPPIEEPARVPDVFELREKVIFRDDMVSYGFLNGGFEAGRAVARLRVQRYDNGAAKLLPGGQEEIYLGTGWLLAPDLLLTNHHVVNARRDGEGHASLADLKLQAQSTSAQFDYDADAIQGTLVNATELVASDPDLDYALLRLEKSLPRTPLVLSRDEINVTDDSYIAVNIIQHPNGQPKKVAIRNNLVYDSKFPKLRYFTDTQHGSSGSPVFNDSWQVVALHRAATYVDSVKFQGRTTGWVNEGTQITAILNDLKAKNVVL